MKIELLIDGERYRLMCDPEPSMAAMTISESDRIAWVNPYLWRTFVAIDRATEPTATGMDPG